MQCPSTGFALGAGRKIYLAKYGQRVENAKLTILWKSITTLNQTFFKSFGRIFSSKFHYYHTFNEYVGTRIILAVLKSFT